MLASSSCVAKRLLLIFSVFSLLLLPLPIAQAQVDDNANALYGGYGNKFQNVRIAGIDFEVQDISDFITSYTGGKAGYDTFRSGLDEVLNKIAEDTLKPEYGLALFRSGEGGSEGSSINTMIIGGRIIIRDGRKMTPPVDHYIAVFDPMIGRPRICLDYPYYRYEHAEPMIMPDDPEDFVQTFKAVVEPLVKRELKRVICTKAENKELPLCVIPCPPPGSVLSSESPPRCREQKNQLRGD